MCLHNIASSRFERKARGLSCFFQMKQLIISFSKPYTLAYCIVMLYFSLKYVNRKEHFWWIYIEHDEQGAWFSNPMISSTPSLIAVRQSNTSVVSKLPYEKKYNYKIGTNHLLEKVNYVHIRTVRQIFCFYLFWHYLNRNLLCILHMICNVPFLCD